MEKIRIGVICPSEIAYRRFMPALKKCEGMEFAGIAAADSEEWFGVQTEKQWAAELDKAEKFIDEYGGRLYGSYKELISDNAVDAVYIPLPPALHYKWAKAALQNGKHVFLEKPFTVSEKDTADLIKTAEEKGLAVHENYMFVYHSQIDFITNEIAKGTVGDVRLYRIAFGFPFRGMNDFRYDKALGGGAMWDCGGYTFKLGTLLLGNDASIKCAVRNFICGIDVDIGGSAVMVNSKGVTAQLAFGMDNSYKCELEVWGSEGTIYTNRILTAPAGYEPVVRLTDSEGERTLTLPSDDTFAKSVMHFKELVLDPRCRKAHFEEIMHQSRLAESFLRESML